MNEVEKIVFDHIEKEFGGRVRSEDLKKILDDLDVEIVADRPF